MKKFSIIFFSLFCFNVYSQYVIELGIGGAYWERSKDDFIGKAYGARISGQYYVTKKLAGGLSYRYYHGIEDARFSKLNADVHVFNLGFVYKLRKKSKKINPFIAGDIGRYFIRAERTQKGTETAIAEEFPFATYWGVCGRVGAYYKLNKKIQLFLEGESHIVRVTESTNEKVFYSNSNVQTFTLHFGISRSINTTKYVIKESVEENMRCKD